MKKKVASAGFSVLVGSALAIVAAWGVVVSSTAAPDHNPSSQQIVRYGGR